MARLVELATESWLAPRKTKVHPACRRCSIILKTASREYFREAFSMPSVKTAITTSRSELFSDTAACSMSAPSAS